MTVGVGVSVRGGGVKGVNVWVGVQVKVGVSVYVGVNVELGTRTVGESVPGGAGVRVSRVNVAEGVGVLWVRRVPT